MTSYIHASVEWRVERESVCFTTSHVDPAGGPCLNFISLSEEAREHFPGAYVSSVRSAGCSIVVRPLPLPLHDDDDDGNVC